MDEENKMDNQADIKYLSSTGDIKTTLKDWCINVKEIDLTNKNITCLRTDIIFPANLTTLNLSHNNFDEVPSAVLVLKNLKHLDLSYNKIQYFDDCPEFCHSLYKLNLSHNHLLRPPYWIWSESPKNLRLLNISYNIHITNSLEYEYYEELKSYSTSVSEIIIYNCELRKHINLLCTFPKAKVLEIGTEDYRLTVSNRMEDMPCDGLLKCCDLQKLNLSNTSIFNINTNISMFINLKEINLSQNQIACLPKEFCMLTNLEVCIISENKLLYLPDEIVKLTKMIKLYLNCNVLCMVPVGLYDLPNLQVLDLYDNSLYDMPIDVTKLKEVDLAQNYFDEPDSVIYIEKRDKLRLKIPNRHNGRKFEQTDEDSQHSSLRSDFYEQSSSSEWEDQTELRSNASSSSKEDWDADEYWTPHYSWFPSPPQVSPWLQFVQAKMKEGNFCPMDSHQLSISELVKYEKECNPTVVYESDGQFDDFSEDDS